MLPELDAFVGQTVGTYVLDSIIGRGSIGAVFLAHAVEDPTSRVAIKVFVPPFLTDATQRGALRKRFVREIAVLQRLQHPHIITILAFGDDPATGLLYMVLPYYSRGTLARIAAKYHPMRFDIIANWLNQLASALDEAHRHGIIHRDIKPENILIDAQGNMILTDFSIMKEQDTVSTTITATDQVLGTPLYMSPEQCEGKPPSPASDVYSLGMVAYFMVAGRPAFVGSTAASVIVQQLHDQPASPQKMRPDLPVPAANAILLALAKHPNERFALANEFSAAFALGIKALPPPPAVGGAGDHTTTVANGAPVPLRLSAPLPAYTPPWPSHQADIPVPLSARASSRVVVRPVWLFPLAVGGVIMLTLLSILLIGMPQGLFGFAQPTPLPTYTVQPTYTFQPTFTSQPTFTPQPTFTIAPTYTPVPTVPPPPTGYQTFVSPDGIFGFDYPAGWLLVSPSSNPNIRTYTVSYPSPNGDTAQVLESATPFGASALDSQLLIFASNQNGSVATITQADAPYQGGVYQWTSVQGTYPPNVTVVGLLLNKNGHGFILFYASQTPIQPTQTGTIFAEIVQSFRVLR